MSKGEEVKCTKEKVKVKGWFIEEMKDKVNSFKEIDTEEIMKWRGLSQEEIDQCWKNWPEKLRLKFRTDTRSRTGQRLLGKNLCLVQRVQLAANTKQTGGAGGSGRDEAATENEDCEGSDEEDQIKKRKSGR